MLRESVLPLYNAPCRGACPERRTVVAFVNKIPSLGVLSHSLHVSVKSVSKTYVFINKKNDENFKHNKYDISSSERPKSFCYVNLVMLCVK